MKTRFYKTLLISSEFILMSLCCYAVVPTSVKDICGKTYPVIRVGDVLWMAENLACTKYDTESEAYKSGFTELSTGYEIYPPYYADVRNSSSDYDEKLTQAIRNKMGLVYNWAAVMGYKTESESKAQTGDYIGIRQGICPNGWHIPSRAEVSKLIQAFGDANTAGYHLKATEGWHNNGNGDNSSGFNMYPSGTHVTAKTSNAVGRNGYISLCDAKSASEHHDLNFYYNSDKADDDGCSKKYAQSVRCVINKDTVKVISSYPDYGTVTGSGIYFYGETVTITATAKEGYEFTGWLDGNQEATRTITVTSDSIFAARFIEKNAQRVTDKCGITYPVIRLGNVLWMAESMACNKYDTESEAYNADFKEITISDTGVYDPYYTDVRYAETQYGTYLTDAIRSRMGYLYNWAALMGYKTGDESKAQTGYYRGLRQGICPNGWHIPSVNEIKALFDVVGGEENAGKKLKSKEGWYENGNGSDVLGFTMYPSGCSNGAAYNYIGTRGYLTLCDAISSTDYSDFDFYYEQDYAKNTGSKKNIGQSVRCIYDIKYYDVNVLSDEEQGTVTGGGTYEEGKTAIIEATPNTGYQFTNWSNRLENNPAEIIVTSDTTLIANFEKIKYSIRFENYDGTLLQDTVFEYGDTPQYTGDEPLKPADNIYTYQFSGEWEPAITPVTENATYTAKFTSKYIDYTVETFTAISNSGTVTITDSEGQEYGSSGTFHYGDVITLTATPSIETWLLKRWSTGATENPLTYTVSDSAKIVAFILPTEIPVNVKLDLNSVPSEGGETIGSGEYETVYKQGTTEPEYTSIAIKAIPNNGYKFVNWTEFVDGEQKVISDQAEYVTSINKNTTYSANFEKKNYIITFRDYNGKKLKQDIVKYGDTPTCPDPERESSTEYTYNFAGWNPSIKAADGNATYFATYTTTKKQYTIKFACDGKILQEEQLDYGTTPIYKGETPTREPSAQYNYTFKGWDYAISPVRGNFTYVALFDKTVNIYLIRFENYDGAELETNNVAYGELPHYYGDTPKRESQDPAYHYTFDGWTPLPIVVTENATYTATYIQELNIFHVDAVSDDANKGTVTGSGDYQAGSVATLTAQPKKGYALDYWSNGEKTASISIVVNKDTTVTAYFGRQNADNTPACNNVASVSKYNWLIMLDLNTLNAEGYTFTENQVRWYKVVGEMDNLSDPDYLRNDEFLKNGYYLTLDKSLTGTGTYYGLIDLVNQSDNVGCLNGIMRTEPHKYDATERNGDCTLLKTLVEPQETLEIINLPKGTKSYIKVFDPVGNMIYETVSDGIENVQFNAASIPGTYMVTVFDDSTKQTLRYIVK